MLTLEQRLYDQWVTREPDFDEPLVPGDPNWPRCENCQAWLKLNPDRTEPWEHTEACTGEPPTVSQVYTDADAGILDIIGWDFLGRTYSVTYPPECGEPQSHPAHRFPVAGGMHLFRACARCGHENQETTA